MSYDNQEWQDVISNIDILKVSNVDYDKDLVDGILFVALRNRGMQRIEGGDLELGLADLEHAEQITGLDEAAKFKNIDFKVFGKPTTRKHRRMAVALSYGIESTDNLVEKAKEVASKIKVD